MANTLTPLIPTIIGAMRTVLRSSGAAMNLFTLDTSPEQKAVGQTVNMPGTASLSASTITPAMTVSNASDITATNETMSIDTFKGCDFDLTADDEHRIRMNQPGFKAQQIQEAVKGVIDAITTYGLTMLDVAAGYAVGTAGTTPFGSNLSALNLVVENLDIEKASGLDRYLVYDPKAKTKLSDLSQFQKANEAPEGVNFARGEMQMLNGLTLGMDQTVTQHTKGTGTGYLADGAHAVGATTITLKTGSGTVLAGDVVTFAADTDNKYVVKTGTSAAGDIVLNAPLRTAIPDDNAMTIAANHRANLATQRSASVLAVRPPMKPEGGDLADDTQVITDPVTGLSLLLSSYPGYFKRKYEVSAVWGGGVRRRAHIIKLMG